MPRSPRPDDLFALRVPTEVALSPDGRQVAFVVKSVAPGRDGYRHAIWLVPADGSAPPRQVTLGRRTDVVPRWSPDGRTLAFLSDRAGVLQAAGAGDEAGPKEAPKEGATQVWLLPADGGEARQLTRLPKDVTDLAWSPDGTALCVVSAAARLKERATARKPEDGPAPDLRFIDRLSYMLNGAGFTYDRPGNLWRVVVADGAATRLTSGTADDGHPVWSPDGQTIAFVSNRHRHSDLTGRVDVFVMPSAGGPIERVTSGADDRQFFEPAWSPDGAWLAVKGFAQARPGVRTDVWRFRPRGGDGVGEDLTGEHDLMVDSAMNSDLFGGPGSRLAWSEDGRWISFTAPVDGAYEVWRVEVASHRVERLTEGRHWLSCARDRAAARRRDPLRGHPLHRDRAVRRGRVRPAEGRHPRRPSGDPPADAPHGRCLGRYHARRTRLPLARGRWPARPRLAAPGGARYGGPFGAPAARRGDPWRTTDAVRLVAHVGVAVPGR